MVRAVSESKPMGDLDETSNALRISVAEDEYPECMVVSKVSVYTICFYTVKNELHFLHHINVSDSGYHGICQQCWRLCYEPICVMSHYNTG